MPGYPKTDSLYNLEELIAKIEQITAEKGYITKKDLQSSGLKIHPSIWVKNGRLIQDELGGIRIYRLSDSYYNQLTKNYKFGVLREDRSSFVPKQGVARDVWQSRLKEILQQKALHQNVFIDNIEFVNKPTAKGAYEYKISFLPARYQSDSGTHHLVFDYVFDTPEEQLKQSRVHKGQGKWLAAAYRQQIANVPPTKPFASVLDETLLSIKARRGLEWASVHSLSETHQQIRLKDITQRHLNWGNGILIDQRTKEFLYTADFFTNKLGTNQLNTEASLKKFLDYVKSTGRKYASVALRSTPAVALTLAAQDVLASENLAEAKKSVVSLTGGGTAAAICGGLAAPFPVLAYGAAIGCGYAGAVASEWMDDKWTNFLTSNSNVETTQIREQAISTKAPDLSHTLQAYTKQIEDMQAQQFHIDHKQVSPEVIEIFQERFDLQLVHSKLDDLKYQGTDIDKKIFAYVEYLVQLEKQKDDYINKEKINKLEAQEQYVIVQYFEGGGQIAFALANFASTVGNPEAGKVLTVTGATATGIGAAIAIPKLAGAAMAFPVAAIITSVAVIASTFIKRGPDASQHTLEQIKLLRQEIMEIRKFLAEFRIELYEKLDRQLEIQERHLFYIEESIVHAKGYLDFKANLNLDATKLVLWHQDEEIIRSSMHIGKQRHLDVSPKEIYALLDKYELLFEKAFSDLYSGATIYKNQKELGALAVTTEVRKMFNLPSERGQVMGYLHCLNQAEDATSDEELLYNKPMPNPYKLDRIARAYLNLIKTPVGMACHDVQGDELNDLIERYKNIISQIKGFRRQHTRVFSLIARIEANVEKLIDLSTHEYLIPVNTTHKPNTNLLVEKENGLYLDRVAVLRSDKEDIRKAAYAARDNFVNAYAGGSVNMDDLFAKAYALQLGEFNSKGVFEFEFFDRPTGALQISAVDYRWGGSGRILQWDGVHHNANFQFEVLNSEISKVSSPIFKTANEKYTELSSILHTQIEKIRSDILYLQAFLLVIGFPRGRILSLSAPLPDNVEEWQAPLREMIKNKGVLPDTNYMRKPLSEYITNVLKPLTLSLQESIEPELILPPSPEIGMLRQTLLELEIHQASLFQSNYSSQDCRQILGEFSVEELLSKTQDHIENALKKVTELTREQQIPTDDSQAVSSLSSQKVLDLLIETTRQNKLLVDYITQQAKDKGSSDQAILSQAKPLAILPAAQAVEVYSAYRKHSDFSICNPLTPRWMLCPIPQQDSVRVVHKLSTVNLAWDEVDGDKYKECNSDKSYCRGELTEYYNIPKLAFAAIYGASTTFIPEAIADTLRLTNIVTKSTAERLKFAMHLLIIGFFISSLKPEDINTFLFTTIVAMITQSLAKALGLSSTASRIISSGTTLFVSSGTNITRENFTNSIVAGTAGSLGLWAEKKVIRIFEQEECKSTKSQLN